ncbi:Ubiquitin-conjugating enzyme E2, catalytic domain ues [Castilleja foliolosa]|uniref:E2 ubiquitin-conjugating enzyme n=1 Tax=Castilleja foliolosa TaxID=1961234 RepID=A0ABD3CQB1_9LAMI
MVSPGPASLYIPQNPNPKKRVFLAESSSSDELESSPPINFTFEPKSSKQKEVIHEIINVDKDGESEEVVLTYHEVDKNAKGKEVMSNSFGGLNGIANDESGDDVDDDASSDLYYDEDDDTYYDDVLYEEEPATLESHFDHMDIPPGVEVSFPWLQGSPKNDKKVPSASTSTHASTKLQSDLNSSDSLLALEHIQMTNLSTLWGDSVTGNGTDVGFMNDGPFTGLAHDPEGNVISASRVETNSVPAEVVEQKNLVEVLRNFDQFKKFDVVEDYSDHHYAKNGSSDEPPPKNWAKRIQEEWKILEKDLPDEIFVRVYEGRMDLLRAVIIGAEGTPYHDGLFFFDVFFPSSYPSGPPLVHYHSRGLRINPNLYNCGKVCLSLLNTWSGGEKEKWIPGESTMLQVLVSIQGLILNTKPYFNEPGYANGAGSIAGEKRSLEYNERTFMYNLQTMGYNMRRPPKHFEDFAVGYFCKNGHGILVSCRAYLGGAQVGSLVKGKVRDVDAVSNSCTKEFKSSLALFMTPLINQFITIGAKDCDEFLYLPELSKDRTAAAKPVSLPASAPIDFFV